MVEQGQLFEQPDKRINVTLSILRNALDTKDKAQLRMVIDGIKRIIDDTDKDLSVKMLDSELDELVATGEGVFLVGTGTVGQRVYIRSNPRELFMSDDRYGQQYRNRFKALFDLPLDGEARIQF
jgi:hypothetical protein